MPSEDVHPVSLSQATTPWSTAWSYLKHGPGHFTMYTLGRFQAVRVAAVQLNKWRTPASKGVSANSSDLCPVLIEEAAERLKTDGLFDGLRLSPETVSELLEYCEQTLCFGDGNRDFEFLISQKGAAEQQYGSKFLLARYLDCRRTCVAMKRLENDPTLRAIARAYFGSEPALIGARIWWSFATEAPPEQHGKSGQTFHYDIDGYRSVSCFFYLTDVDEDAGAHTYVRGSHRKKRLSHLLSIYKSHTDHEIAATYNHADIQNICGRAGQGFAEDTFCFHKGLSPRARDRLVLQVRFGLRDYGTSPAG